MRLTIPAASLLALLAAGSVHAAAPGRRVFKPTEISVTSKHAFEPMGHAVGEFTVMPILAPRVKIPPTVVKTTPAARKQAMARTIKSGDTPSIALFSRGGALKLKGYQAGVPVYVAEIQEDGQLDAEVLAPVSGHVDLTSSDDHRFMLELDDRDHGRGPEHLVVEAPSVGFHSDSNGAYRYKGRVVLGVGRPTGDHAAQLEARVATARRFAKDTTFDVQLQRPDGTITTQTAAATGLVTSIALELGLGRGLNRLTVAPQRSGGPPAFHEGRTILIERP